MDILEKIVADKKLEVEHRKAALPLAQLKERIDRTGIGRTPSLKASLQQGGYGIISEFKRRSPSRGWINEGARASAVPLSYQKSGAAAISILTDGKYFGGSDSFVHEARQSGVILPVLYKNFIIDEYQLYEAKMCGSSAVLLIAACLSEELCGRYIELAHRLGMEVLLEVHSEGELPYLRLNPDMCGVNNRNLGTFETDVENSFRLAEKLPRHMCRISESGISDPNTVARLVTAGYTGFLIGETFMKTADPGLSLRRYISEIDMILKERVAK